MSKKQRQSNRKPKKMRFEVLDGEAISDCLDRMDKEGYMPTRRMEEPIFEEKMEDGELKAVPCGRKIVFEGKIKAKTEH